MGQLTHLKYRADIDGLRAFAVISVIGFHAFPNWVRGGFVGVDIFFVISGFLISSIIFGNLEHDSFSYREFYARRVKRIFPALALVLIGCFCYGWYILLVDEFRQLAGHTVAATTFLSNFVLWSEAGYFDNAAETKPLLHLWSLAIEEQFYIFWPLLLGAVWKRRGSFLWITVGVAILSFALNVYIVHRDPVAAFYSPMLRFWELMLGGILAYLVLHKRHLINRYPNAQSWMGFFLLVAGIYLISSRLLFPGWWALLPVLGSFLVISGGDAAWVNRVLLSNRLSVWFGLISYPLYLWHWPILVWPKISTGNLTTVPERLALIGISVLLAWLTYYFLERNVRHRSGNITAKLAIIFTVIGLVSLVAYGGLIRSRHDNPELEKILNAKLDWDYPGIAFERLPDPNLRYFSAKGKPSKTVFIGDSNMEQYAPRIGYLLKKNPSEYNTAVIAGVQSECVLLLEVIQQAGVCNSTIAKMTELIRDEGVRSVVFAANWLAYDSSIEVDAQYKNILKYLKENAKNKKIYIILNMPRGEELDPKNMYVGSRFGSLRSKRMNDVTFDISRFENSLAPVHHKLRQLAQDTGAVIIDPLITLCENGRCLIFDREGHPLYRDAFHITATYAEKSATFIDRTLK